MLVRSRLPSKPHRPLPHRPSSGRAGTQRPGAALIEMAFVLTIFLMLLFGIMEYCRFLFYRQLVTNAAREGARYAVVNTDEAALEATTKAKVTAYMAGMDKNMKNFKCLVYKADAAGNNTGAPDTAAFGEHICVEISLDYDPILPAFLFMGNTIKIQTKSLMYSEAN